MELGRGNFALRTCFDVQVSSEHLKSPGQSSFSRLRERVRVRERASAHPNKRPSCHTQSLKMSPALSSPKRLALGCMGMAPGGPLAPASIKAAIEAFEAALVAGITLFDHADIYGGGSCEAVFKHCLEALPEAREQIQIWSKGGIGGGRYNLSKPYLRDAIEASMTRLGVERIDLYQLHRPDPLAHPAETAEALNEAMEQGKIGAVGVSNYYPEQTRALQKHLAAPIVSNQFEINALRLAPFYEGWEVPKIRRLQQRHGQLWRRAIGFLHGRANHAARLQSSGARDFDQGAVRRWARAGRFGCFGRVVGKIRRHAHADRSGLADSRIRRALSRFSAATIPRTSSRRPSAAICAWSAKSGIACGRPRGAATCRELEFPMEALHPVIIPIAGATLGRRSRGICCPRGSARGNARGNARGSAR